MQLKLKFVALFCCLLVLVGVAVGQNVTATISGTVTDNSGAALPNAKITVTNIDTGIVARMIAADASGNYSVPSLPVGHYSLTSEAPGFKTFNTTNIEVNANDKLTVNLAMQIGQASESITVEANATQVELQTPAASGLITGLQVQELTLATRNYEQLVALQPGVSYGGTGDQIYVGATSPLGTANTVNFSINGSRNSANNWTIDGADNVDRGSNLTLLTYPSVDAIAEFKTIRNQYDAEYGRDASGIINVITKSGTRNYHGNAYEFFRNDVLTANTVANKQLTPQGKRPPLRYNDFGYTFGGPVPFLKKNSQPNTFFFWSQEYRRVINYSPFTAEIPTAQQRQGIFAHDVCIGHAVSSSNVASCTAVLPAGTALTNINPVAQGYLKDVYNNLPLPNNANNDPNAFGFTARGIFNDRQDLIRIDHTFGPRLNVFYRYMHDTFPTVEPGGLFLGSALTSVSQTQTTSPGTLHIGHVTASISPTFLVDAGYAYSYGAIISKPTGTINTAQSPDINAPNFFGLTLPRVPGVSFTTFSNITGNGPYNDFNRNHNIFGNLTKVLGEHTFKFGVSYNHYQKTENALGNGLNIAGTYSFVGGPRPATGGATTMEQSFADFLTGFVPTYTQTGLTDLTPNMNTHQTEAFAQDNWRIRPNLTLTFGVRYSLFAPPVDANHELTTFDPSLYKAANAPTLDASGNICVNAAGCPGPTGGPATVLPNPNFDPLNGISINGKTSPYGDKVSSTDHANFAPRLGFAWDPIGDGKTSVRGGYGVAYDSTLFGIYEQNIFVNPPFFQTVSITNTSFSNPKAGVVGGTTSINPLRGTSPHMRTPYTQQWSLDFQRELAPSLLFDIGYFGSKGTHLLGLADINELPPNAYQAALGSSTNITSGNTNLINRLRPYVGYKAINEVLPIFDSNYNSLQTSLQKRFRGGSIITANYTWSKCLTDNQTDRSTAVENIYNLGLEYGPCQLDRRQVFTGSYVYELPFFQKQSGIVGHVLGGWEVSGILTGNTGLPFTVTTLQNYDPAGLGVKESTSNAAPRPNQIGDPNSGAPHSIAQWFNTSAFADVPLGVHTPGSARRGSIEGPGFWRWDASLFKNIKFTETMSMQFRGEASNVLNHTNYATINTSLGNASFGRVTGYREPRIVQLGLKLYF